MPTAKNTKKPAAPPVPPATAKIYDSKSNTGAPVIPTIEGGTLDFAPLPVKKVRTGAGRTKATPAPAIPLLYVAHDRSGFGRPVDTGDTDDDGNAVFRAPDPKNDDEWNDLLRSRNQSVLFAMLCPAYGAKSDKGSPLAIKVEDVCAVAFPDEPIPTGDDDDSKTARLTLFKRIFQANHGLRRKGLAQTEGRKTVAQAVRTVRGERAYYIDPATQIVIVKSRHATNAPPAPPTPSAS